MVKPQFSNAFYLLDAIKISVLVVRKSVYLSGVIGGINTFFRKAHQAQSNRYCVHLSLETKRHSNQKKKRRLWWVTTFGVLYSAPALYILDKVGFLAVAFPLSVVSEVLRDVYSSSLPSLSGHQSVLSSPRGSFC